MKTKTKPNEPQPRADEVETCPPHYWIHQVGDLWQCKKCGAEQRWPLYLIPSDENLAYYRAETLQAKYTGMVVIFRE